MSSDVTRWRAADHVDLIELSRPEENFLDTEVVRAIADRLAECESDPSCRAIVLASNGRHFCAGAQLNPDDDDRPEGATNPLYDQVRRLFVGTVPVVAAVQGAAIGAGLGLALAADFRVASPRARFAATFTRLGFHHGFGLSVTLPRAVGHQRALELLYTGRRVGGDEASTIGLCERLVESGSERAVALEMARQIAESAPLAVRATRRTMRGHLADEIGRATDREHAEQVPLRRTGDHREGVLALQERRPPRFEGC